MAMAENAFDPTQWAAAMQKAQADMMGRWSQWNSLWTQAGRTAATGVPPAAGAAAGSVQAPFIQQFEQYLGITRSLWELLGRTASINDGAERVRVFNEGLAGLPAQLGAMFMPAGANPWQGMMQGMMQGMTQGMIPPMFGMPALGPAREQQESWQRASAAAMRCTQAQTRLAAQWNEIVAAGLRELGQQMSPGLQAGRMPGSLKEVYDSWVNAAESAFARAAHGAAFIQAQAELGNALAELRLAQREIMEEWARQFDLPTRAELNSLHKQVRDLTAAVKRLGG
jgi:class III poly(R)-hydroxyalkanoic acid synthase PhaE subunit